MCLQCGNQVPWLGFGLDYSRKDRATYVIRDTVISQKCYCIWSCLSKSFFYVIPRSDIPQWVQGHPTQNGQRDCLVTPQATFNISFLMGIWVFQGHIVPYAIPKFWYPGCHSQGRIHFEDYWISSWMVINCRSSHAHFFQASSISIAESATIHTLYIWKKFAWKSSKFVNSGIIILSQSC